MCYCHVLSASNIFLVQVQKQKNGVSCTTGDLIKLNDRITESLNDIYLMTNEVIKPEFDGKVYGVFVVEQDPTSTLLTNK